MAVVVATGVALSLALPVANAAEPERAGWWSAAGPLATVLGPDVPEGGILVQSGPSEDAPTAYGALAYALGPEESPETLTLNVAPDSASTTAAPLKLCLAPPSFEAVEGGPIDDAPPFDCSTSAEASPVDGVYTFDVGAFAGESLTVAVLPGADPGRVVLDKPGAASLTAGTTSGTSMSSEPMAPASGPSPGPSVAPPSSGGVLDSAPGAGSFDFPSATGSLAFDPLPRPDLASSAGPAADGEASPSEEAETGSETASDVLTPSVTGAQTAADESGSALAELAALALLTAGVGSWLISSRSAAARATSAEGGMVSDPPDPG